MFNQLYEVDFLVTQTFFPIIGFVQHLGISFLLIILKFLLLTNGQYLQKAGNEETQLNLIGYVICSLHLLYFTYFFNDYN